MNSSASSAGAFAEQMCLTCGLCCNGVIFADVQLQAGDNAARLREAGLALTSTKSPQNDERRRGPGNQKFKFRQPCAALEGCRCRVYEQRPVYCRQFECLLLKSVADGRTRLSAALGIIKTARERADRVRDLLRELGDTEETLALSARFRRTAKRLASGVSDDATADKYGELTLAVHDLNLLLSEAFYPGAIA